MTYTFYNCSRSDIQQYVEHLLRITKSQWLHVGLDDKHTKDPYFWISRDDEKRPLRFFSLAFITTGIKEARELGLEPDIVIPDDEGEHIIKLDELVDMLYTYITENYS